MGDAPASSIELVQQLTQANGELRVESPRPATRAAWRRAIHALINSQDVPPGLRVRHTGRDSGNLIIRLVPDSPENDPRPAQLEPVPIPARLTGAHPILVATRELAKRRDRPWVDTRSGTNALHVNISPASLRRVLLLAQALIDEATRRGYEIKTGGGYECPGGLGLSIAGHFFEISFSEEMDRTPHQPRKYELEHAARNSWVRIPEWDYVPSGRLQLWRGHDANSGKRLTGDRLRWRLDDRLALALHAIEGAAAEAERQYLERQRMHEERRRAWEEAVATASEQWREVARAQHLREQVANWRLASDIRALVGGVRARGCGNDGHPDEDWLTWADAYAANLDPSTRSLTFPEERDPTAEELAPHLEGWSPYGPDAARRWRP